MEGAEFGNNKSLETQKSQHERFGACACLRL